MGGCTPSGLPRTIYSITYPLSFKFLRTLLRFFALIQKLNPFIFKRFRTLYQKHGGGRRVTMLFLSRNSNLRYLAYRISRRRPPALSSFPISLPPYFLSGASSNHQSLQSTHVALPKRPRRPYHRSFTPNPTMSPPSIPGPSPIYEDYARCIHCGLCLNACPTYRLWNLEADSPRGRIHQMIHVELDRQPITDSFVDHIDKCLDCRACETACPSGVEYGKLVEYARARIERDYRRPLLSRIARDVVYRRLLPVPRRIATVARLLRFYQRSGFQSLARSTGILKILGLDKRERLLP